MKTKLLYLPSYEDNVTFLSAIRELDAFNSYTYSKKKMHYYQVGLSATTGKPFINHVGYQGAHTYTRVTSDNLKELQIIPNEAKVHFLLSL